MPDVVDARQKFTKKITPEQEFLRVVGSAGTERLMGRTVTTPEAVRFGKRRIMAALGAATVAVLLAAGARLGYEALIDDPEASRSYQERIENCAAVLSGEDVDLKRDPVDGGLVVSEDVRHIVSACQRASGDATIAERFMSGSLAQVSIEPVSM